MRPVALLTLLVCVAIAQPAFARFVPEGSLDLRSISLVPKRASVFADLGFAQRLDLGGGDGIVTGPLRTLGWVALGLGAAGVVVGGSMLRGDSGSQAGIGAVAVGGLLAIAGGIIIFTTGCVSCGSCGIVDNTPNEPPPARDAFAGRDPRRKPNGFSKLPMLSFAF